MWLNCGIWLHSRATFECHIMVHLCTYGRNGQKTAILVSFDASHQRLNDASHQAKAIGIGIKAVRPILTKLRTEIFSNFRNLSRYNLRLTRVRQKCCVFISCLAHQ